MSLLKCKYHGEAGSMPYVSIGLADKINNRVYLESSSIKTVHVVFNDEGEYLFDRYYFFIEDVFKKLSLKEEYIVDTDEEEKDFEELFFNQLGITCIDCFKDYMKEIGYAYSL